MAPTSWRTKAMRCSLLNPSLLSRSPSICVDRKGKKVYMIMQYIPGTDLDTLWPLLSQSGKQSILGQLRSMFNEMRSLPPRDFFGSVEKGPVPHRYFFSRDKNPAVTGPFEEGGGLLTLRSQSDLDRTGRTTMGTDGFRTSSPALKNHDSLFTHSDLHPQNITVQQTVDPQSATKHYVVGAIVDWETAGWFPAYWENAAAFALLRWFDDWPERLEEVVDPWPLEGAMMRFVHQDLEF